MPPLPLLQHTQGEWQQEHVTLTQEQDNNIIVLKIPTFMRNGNLPPGIHQASLAQIEQRFANSEHRQTLFKGLKLLALHLKQAGCQTLYVDGSYITAKAIPSDYDAVWDPTGITNKVEPDLLKRERIEYRKKKYLGDVFVHVPELGGFPHLDHFQRDKHDDSAKGILKVDLRKPL